MNSFVGVTDNDWFAFLSQQPRIYEINLLPKTVSHKNGGQALSKNW
jgi:hypothetical protein